MHTVGTAGPPRAGTGCGSRLDRDVTISVKDLISPAGQCRWQQDLEPREDPMTARHEPPMISGATPGKNRPRRRRGYGWMMIACIPMMLIAVVLVATGIASPGFLVIAIGCMLMTGIMMTGVRRGSGDGT
jgi:hypothetical protein